MNAIAPIWPLRWVGLQRPAIKPEMRLFAFPYAGSGASVYRPWIDGLAHEQWLDFVAVQLPGRESRLDEPPCRNIDALLDDLVPAMTPKLDLPYALFGYSLGALLAYELAIRFAEMGRAPELLVLAARGVPQSRAGTRRLDRSMVIEKIAKLGGTAPGVIESPLFDSHFLPLLLADFTIADSHYRPFPQILPLSILALAADNDPEVPIKQVLGWKMMGGQGFDLERFNSGHFFLHSENGQVLATLAATLGAFRPGPSR